MLAHLVLLARLLFGNPPAPPPPAPSGVILRGRVLSQGCGR